MVPYGIIKEKKHYLGCFPLEDDGHYELDELLCNSVLQLHPHQQGVGMFQSFSNTLTERALSTRKAEAELMLSFPQVTRISSK